MSRAITLHRCGHGIDEHLAVVADDVNATYTVSSPRGCHVYVPFHRPWADPKLVNGVSLEALLAVVLDRLERHQQGPCPCAENAEAARHGSLALAALQRRTRRRAALGLEGQLVEKAPAPAELPVRVVYKKEEEPVARTDRPAVYVEDGAVFVGVKKFRPDDLARQWAVWDAVLCAAKALPVPLTAADLDLLEALPKERPGQSGCTEFKQAYAQHVQVKGG